MAKALFRPSELTVLPERVFIETPTSFPELAHLTTDKDDIVTLEEVEEYTGPTADDIRREIEEIKTQWEDEKEAMMLEAQEKAAGIIREAEEAAAKILSEKTDEGEALKKQAQDESENVMEEARRKAWEIGEETVKTAAEDRKTAQEQGRAAGREEGFAEGRAEVERLVERTQVILERAQNKRGEILKEAEQEIIDLVLLISRKVIKIISENQRGVIVSNVAQALRKVRAKGNIIIRVNMKDLKLATEYKQEFIKLMEGANSLQIAEDSRVDAGGCIIETDFGEIDARISSQLAEIESKILDISPIKSPKKENLPPPVVRTAGLNADLASSLNELDPMNEQRELTSGENAALTASAAMAALTAMSLKGKRSTDKKI
ncbi:MAG: flagellar assembly protein FliH [Treponema sp.]|nr:flagellar assembly protein FliH [Treponema sp.]